MIKMKKIFSLILGLLFFTITSCVSKKTESVPIPVATCANVESVMTASLAAATSEVDFSFAAERSDGRRFTYQRGSSTISTSYESASTSKLVTAVIILRLVEQGYLTLTDHPQDHINTWTITNGDSLYAMTLAQLLSFTSGLESEPLCLNSGISNFATCVNNIGSANAGNGVTPGTRFYYGGTHLQVAGMMAIKARNVASWQNIFSEFKTQTGLFTTAAYDLPSTSNPRLAGGMHWTAEEYLDFLKALKAGQLLNTASMNLLLADRTTSVTMAYSPAMTGLSEDWHYGYGLWQECQSATYNCTAGSRISSPGAYGAYPYWDRNHNYIAIVARQGSLGTYTNGIAIERSVRTQVETWAACN